MSASNTGLTACSLWLEWMYLTDGQGTHLVGSWTGLGGVVVVPDARETRLIRCANCHCNRTERRVRRRNIFGVPKGDVQQRQSSEELKNHFAVWKVEILIPKGGMFCLSLSRVAVHGFGKTRCRVINSPLIADDFPTARSIIAPGRKSGAVRMFFDPCRKPSPNIWKLRRDPPTSSSSVSFNQPIIIGIDTMLEPTIYQSLIKPSRQPLKSCLRCQYRIFSTTQSRLAGHRFKASTPPAKAPPPDALEHAAPRAPVVQVIPPPDPSQLANAPRRYGKRVDQFVPMALYRPIGMQHPPKAGENTGIDTRTMKQKRDDLVNWEQHLKRREEL